jgi:hypothetical protein
VASAGVEALAQNKKSIMAASPKPWIRTEEYKVEQSDPITTSCDLTEPFSVDNDQKYVYLFPTYVGNVYTHSILMMTSELDEDVRDNHGTAKVS